MTLQAFREPGGSIFLFRGSGAPILRKPLPRRLPWKATYPLRRIASEAGWSSWKSGVVGGDVPRGTTSRFGHLRLRSRVPRETLRLDERILDSTRVGDAHRARTNKIGHMTENRRVDGSHRRRRQSEGRRRQDHDRHQPRHVPRARGPPRAARRRRSAGQPDQRRRPQGPAARRRGRSTRR